MLGGQSFNLMPPRAVAGNLVVIHEQSSILKFSSPPTAPPDLL
jgi:hypothetical protein